VRELHLKPGLTVGIWVNDLDIIWYERISSTNTAAKKFAENGAAEWTVLASKTQTKGRGRSGRPWRSPEGGLWFSVVIRPRITPSQAPILQLLFANGLRQAVEKISPIHPEVKWPNDLVVHSRKLAGILIETKVRGKELVYGIVGIGLNLNLAAKQLPKNATSLLIETESDFELERSLDIVLETLRRKYERLRDRKSILSEWWRHCAHRLTDVRVQTPSGLIRGKCVGINPNGSITIQNERGNISVTDGILRIET